MKKINIAKLLENCPKGMELDCTEYDGFVKFDGFNKNNPYTIRIIVFHDGCVNIHNLTEYGQTSISSYNKCVIFPKGKTTWEGFVPPCKFKEGDVLTTDLVHFIFKSQDNRDCYMHCYYAVVSNNFSTSDTAIVDSMYVHPATKEQLYILFQKMKEAGYEWNAETKTLEKLVNMEDKEINNFNVLPGLYKCVHRMFDGTPDGKLLFEVGNIYKCLSKHDRAEFEVSYGHSIYLEDPVVCKHFIPFETQGEQKSNPCEKCNHPMLNCHNFPCIKKKTFDQGKSALEAIREERVDNANKIEPKFKVGDNIRIKGESVIHVVTEVRENLYILDTKDISLPVKIQDQYQWELVPNKFDINTLVPFESRVLVREYKTDVWEPKFYGFFNQHNKRFYTTSSGTWLMCIPYNEDTKHLTGTTDDCDEYYKIWE